MAEPCLYFPFESGASEGPYVTFQLLPFDWLRLRRGLEIDYYGFGIIP